MPQPTPETPRTAPPSGEAPGRRIVTLPEWAESRGLNLGSLRANWVGKSVTDPRSGQTVTFPQPCGSRATGRGPARHEYDEAELDRYRAAKAAAVAATAGRRTPTGVYDPDEHVTDKVAAARLGINFNTFRSYTTLYRDGENPLPPKQGGKGGTRRWGDLLAWNERRSGGKGRRDSGPRAPATREQTLARAVAFLRDAFERKPTIDDSDVPQLAEALGVKPARARRYLADAMTQAAGELGLLTRADIAARLPGGDTPVNREKAKYITRRKLQPVIAIGNKRYYRAEEVESVLAPE